MNFDPVFNGAKAIPALLPPDTCQLPAETLSSLINYIRNGQTVGSHKLKNILQQCAKNEEEIFFIFGEKENNPTLKVHWYMLGAEFGCARSYNALGEAYASGEGIEKNEAEAVKWFLKGADRKLAQSCTNLGRMYFFGLGVKEDKEKAKIYYFQGKPSTWDHSITNKDYHKAVAYLYYALSELEHFYKSGEEIVSDLQIADFFANHGKEVLKCICAVGLFELGELYEYGSGIKKSEKEAFKYYLLSLEKGYEPAVDKIAITYEKGLREAGFHKKGLTWTDYLFDNGLNLQRVIDIISLGFQSTKEKHPAFIHCLGRLFEKQGNKVQASLFYEKAVKAGWRFKKDDALRLRVSCYSTGLEELELCHYENAEKLLRRAAEEGYILAYQSYLRCLQGIRDHDSIAEGIKWYSKIDARKSASDCLNIAMLYEAISNPCEAMVWYQIAFESGEAESRYISSHKIAIIHEKLGNLKEALHWSRQALDLGAPEEERIARIIERILAKGRELENEIHRDPESQLKAIEYFKLAAETNNAEACVHLGKIYETKNEIDNALIWYLRGADLLSKHACSSAARIYDNIGDFPKAVSLYKKALSLGAPVQRDLSHLASKLYNLGIECLERNKPESVRYLQTAAELKFSVAYRELGRIFEEGELVAKNLDTAMEWFQKGDNSGDPFATKGLARIFESKGDYLNAAQYYFKANKVENGGLAQDECTQIVKVLYDKFTSFKTQSHFAEMAQYLVVIASRDPVLASLELGRLYESGQGMPLDLEKANYWYSLGSQTSKCDEPRPASAQRDARYCLARLQEKRGFLNEAAKNYESLALGNYVQAYNDYGRCLECGIGIPNNVEQAMLWYKKGADLDQREACYNFARLQWNKGNKAEAGKWYRKAAEKDFLLAFNPFGTCIENGHGFQPSDEIALTWYLKASAYDSQPEACYNAARLKEKKGEKCEAARLFKRAAELGHILSFNEYGRCLELGIGVQVDEKSALSWYQKGADHNQPVACWNLAKIHQKQGNITESAKAFHKAANLDYAPAYNELGFHIENGIYFAKDVAIAKTWYQKGADNNQGAACYNLARILNSNGDFIGASKWYKKSAELGFVLAFNELGSLYERGIGFDKNIALAEAWYRKGAEHNQMFALANLGRIYENGLSGNVDLVKAYFYYKKAAILGDASLFHKLGFLTQHGYGCTKDEAEALSWYRLGIQNNQPLAAFLAAILYETATTFPRNFVEALALYKKSAEWGHSPACFELGLRYELGQGANKNFEEAYTWYLKAASYNVVPAYYKIGCFFKEGIFVSKDLAKSAEWFKAGAERGHGPSCYEIGHLIKEGQGLKYNLNEARKWLELGKELNITAAARSLKVLNEREQDAHEGGFLVSGLVAVLGFGMLFVNPLFGSMMISSSFAGIRYSLNDGQFDCGQFLKENAKGAANQLIAGAAGAILSPPMRVIFGKVLGNVIGQTGGHMAAEVARKKINGETISLDDFGKTFLSTLPAAFVSTLALRINPQSVLLAGASGASNAAIKRSLMNFLDKKPIAANVFEESIVAFALGAALALADKRPKVLGKGKKPTDDVKDKKPTDDVKDKKPTDDVKDKKPADEVNDEAPKCTSGEYQTSFGAIRDFFSDMLEVGWECNLSLKNIMRCLLQGATITFTRGNEIATFRMSNILGIFIWTLCPAS